MYKRCMKAVQVIFIPILLMSLSINFYGVFLFLNNVNEIQMIDVIHPFLILNMVGIAIWIITLLAVIDYSASILIGMISCVLFGNYAIIESVVRKFFPFVRYWHVLVILIGIWGMACCLFRKRKILLFQDLSKILGIVLFAMVIFNVIININDILKKINSSNSTAARNEKEYNIKKNNNEDMRNVYYLVFDEYAANSFMEKYYDYDNSEFTDWLESQGFLVSYSSRSDTYDTKIVMTNNVNLDYITTPETYDDSAVAARENGKLFEVFRDEGYYVRVIGDNDFYGMPNVVNSEEKTKNAGVTNEGFNFEELVLKNTPLYVWITTNNLDERLQELNECIEFMKTPSNMMDSGVFTMMHIELPHASFVFDQDGNRVDAVHLNDWEDPKYYRNQYIYTTKKMREIVENIIEVDPEAIILLTSDHSARNMSSIQEEDKSQCFVALYDMQADFNDIEGESVINLLRMILNELFDSGFDMVEMP